MVALASKALSASFNHFIQAWLSDLLSAITFTAVACHFAEC